MEWTEPLTFLNFGSLLKRLFTIEFFWPTFVRRICWRMTNCKKTVVYVALQDIESNDVSNLLEKESTQMVTRSLAPQARRLQSMVELPGGLKFGQKTINCLNCARQSANHSETCFFVLLCRLLLASYRY